MSAILVGQLQTLPKTMFSAEPELVEGGERPGKISCCYQLHSIKYVVCIVLYKGTAEHCKVLSVSVLSTL